MIQKITDLVKDQFYLFFIAGLIIVGLLAIGALIRKPKCAISSVVLTVLLIMGFIFAIYNRYKYTGELELYLGLFMVVVLIQNVVIYLIVLVKQAKFIHLVKSASNVESTIYAYLNNKGKILYYTNDFLDLFNISSSEELESIIYYVHQGEKQYSYKAFLSILTDDKEDDYNITVDLSNSKEVKLALSKRKVISKGNLLGYVLIKQRVRGNVQVAETNSNAILLSTLNLVTEAIALYDSDTNKYVLNKKMQVALGVEEVSNLDDFIYFEDRIQLEKRAKVEGDKSRIFYRLDTPNGRFWVQENAKIQNSKLTMVVKETDFKNLIYNFRDYSKLIADLDQLLMTLNNFALVYIDLYNLDSIKDKIGKDASLVLATQFFSNINNDVKDLKVYEIGYYKYAFIIRSEETYNNILRDLNNNTSTLLKANLNFNDLSFEIRSYLGFVERNNVSDPTTELMMNLAEESLKLASNKDYSKDYSIYFSKKKQIEEEVKNIDLSDDFLDKILK
jgi:GGDEF domain-containing protein